MPRYEVSDEHRAFARNLRRTQTAQEEALWHALRNKRLNGWKFSRQVPIGPYVADFLCPAARLVVEIDGPLHKEPDRLAKDAERNRYLRGEGFRTIRFNHDVAVGRLLDAIAEALEQSPSPDLRASAKATLPRRGGG
jgi:very-short-patch-repair endonuclease